MVTLLDRLEDSIAILKMRVESYNMARNDYGTGSEPHLVAEMLLLEATRDIKQLTVDYIRSTHKESIYYG